MKVRAKPGYNIDLYDINISLQSSKGWVDVDDELLNSSIAVKRLKKFIEISDKDEENPEPLQANKNLAVQRTESGAFVMGRIEENRPISNAVVMDPNNEVQQPVQTAQPQNLINDSSEKKINKEIINQDSSAKASVKSVNESIKDSSVKDTSIKDAAVKDASIKNEPAKEGLIKEAEVKTKTEVKAKETVKENSTSTSDSVPISAEAKNVEEKNIEAKSVEAKVEEKGIETKKEISNINKDMNNNVSFEEHKIDSIKIEDINEISADADKDINKKRGRPKKDNN